VEKMGMIIARSFAAARALLYEPSAIFHLV
jgi:hypothetical protein